jgi:hypothetical protein
MTSPLTLPLLSATAGMSSSWKTSVLSVMSPAPVMLMLLVSPRSLTRPMEISPEVRPRQSKVMVFATPRNVTPDCKGIVRVSSIVPSLSKSIVTVKLVPPSPGTLTVARASASPALGALAWRRMESVRACSRYEPISRSEAERRMWARARVMPMTANVETTEIIAMVMTSCNTPKPRWPRLTSFRLTRFNIFVS